MAENNIKYLNDSNNKEFIEIYEDEIKRLVQKMKSYVFQWRKKKIHLMFYNMKKR